jgi:hypothetical protein
MRFSPLTMLLLLQFCQVHLCFFSNCSSIGACSSLLRASSQECRESKCAFYFNISASHLVIKIHISSFHRSKIVELDAKDGKNIFYLPKGSDLLAVIENVSPEGKVYNDIEIEQFKSKRGGSINSKDIKSFLERKRLNEQIVLESIGKANR